MIIPFIFLFVFHNKFKVISISYCELEVKLVFKKVSERLDYKVRFSNFIIIVLNLLMINLFDFVFNLIVFDTLIKLLTVIPK